jgi:hypothetical protein
MTPTSSTYSKVSRPDLPHGLEGLLEVGRGLALVVSLDGRPSQRTVGALQEGQGLRIPRHQKVRATFEDPRHRRTSLGRRPWRRTHSRSGTILKMKGRRVISFENQWSPLSKAMYRKSAKTSRASIASRQV